MTLLIVLEAEVSAEVRDSMFYQLMDFVEELVAEVEVTAMDGDGHVI